MTACDCWPVLLGHQSSYLCFGNDVCGKFDNGEISLADGPLDFVVAHSGWGGPGGWSVARVGQATSGRAGTSGVADAGGWLGSVLRTHACVGRSRRVRNPGCGGPSSTPARHGRHLLASLQEQQAALRSSHPGHAPVLRHFTLNAFPQPLSEL